MSDQPERYRPSCGTEGECFQAAWCDKCEREEHDEDCEILCNTYCYDVNDPEYPKEWIYGKHGPECTAFIPIGDPIPYRDDQTVDMFQEER